MALVVRREQQDEPVALRVAEHPEQERTGFLPGMDPVPQIPTDPELEQSGAEPPSELGRAGRDPEALRGAAR